MKEAFNIGWDLPPDHPEVIAGEPFRGVNVWPVAESFPDFRATMLAYFDACHQLGIRLHRALEHDLGVAETFFDDKLDQPLATLRVLHYPRALTVSNPARSELANTPITATSRCLPPTTQAVPKCAPATASGYRRRTFPAR